MRTLTKNLALVLALAMAFGLSAVPALAAPEAAMDETVLVDCGEAVMTVTAYDAEGDYGPAFELLLENKSDRDLFFSLDDLAVNGVMCDPFWGQSVPAGKKVYSDVSWYPEDLRSVGINYISEVSGAVSIFDDDSYEDVYAGGVSWALTLGETDLPPVERVEFPHGFAEQTVFEGDVSLSVVDYDPAGGSDGGPLLVFYLQNNTDRPAYFSTEDVAVNGFVCDPYWGMTVSPGASAYGRCEWWLDDLEKSHIDSVQTIEFRALAEDDDWNELNSGSASLDVSGMTVTVTADAQTTAAPAPVELDGEVAALMGTVDGNTYTNDYFGLTFEAPEEWSFYTQQELLAQYGLAAEHYEGTEMGEQIEQFMNSEDGFSVMMAQTQGGLQNVSALVETLPGLGRYLSESELLDLVENDLGLGEDGDMSSLGLEGAVLTRGAVTFADGEHEAFLIHYTDTSMGIELPMYIQLVFLMKEDYLLQLTITTGFEDHTAEIGEMFTLAQ